MQVGEANSQVTGPTWDYQNPFQSLQTASLTDWDNQTLWCTYTILTDLDSAFRNLKAELGMWPAYHHKEDCCEGHLFITVHAYQAKQVIYLTTDLTKRPR